tara:strand:- start:405 stop:689 length:285 start_codon:yes stop_codon:yes gene_type:complete
MENNEIDRKLQDSLKDLEETFQNWEKVSRVNKMLETIEKDQERQKDIKYEPLSDAYLSGYGSKESRMFDKKLGGLIFLGGIISSVGIPSNKKNK